MSYRDVASTTTTTTPAAVPGPDGKGPAPSSTGEPSQPVKREETVAPEPEGKGPALSPVAAAGAAPAADTAPAVSLRAAQHTDRSVRDGMIDTDR